MSRFFDLVSKPVRDMGGYAPALPTKPSVVEQLRLIGLDSNENPFGPSPRAVEAMLAALTSANSYPEDDCTEFAAQARGFYDNPRNKCWSRRVRPRCSGFSAKRYWDQD